MKKSIESTLERLYALRTHGIKPGLETAEALVAALGHPEQSFAVVHVAGTNGKGSVCAMLESVLRVGGLRTGLYTSPHLIRFNERMRVMGEAITDAELADLFEVIEPCADRIQRDLDGREVTFFELTTALAFEHFRRKRVQVAVVEVGMGGRLDATNVVLPLVSVITRISLEHTQYLGATLAAIAGEKAGIIKAGRPVVCGAMADEAREVMRATAASRGAPFVDAMERVSVRRVSQGLGGQKVAISGADADYGTMTLRMLGKHQLENCATVVAAVETLADHSPIAIPAGTLKAGLEAAEWVGRLQVLSMDPPVLLDGAHNPDGARALAVALKELRGKRKVGLVWGMCSDKDALGFAKALGAQVHRCWTVPIATERSQPPEPLAHVALTEGWEAEPVVKLDVALGAAWQWAHDTGGLVCIAGSLFLAGEVLEVCKPVKGSNR